MQHFYECQSNISVDSKNCNFSNQSYQSYQSYECPSNISVDSKGCN